LPSNWRLLTTRGNILDSLGRDEEVLAAYDGALAVVPTDDLLAQKTIWINRGSCLSRLEQYGKAEEAFQHGVALRPDTADVWFYRAINQRHWGVARYLAGDMEGAKACIKQAIEYSRRTMALDPAATDPPRLLAVVQQFADIQLEGV
jgi:tetratricopeptide (TPR) repeat protein